MRQKDLKKDIFFSPICCWSEVDGSSHTEFLLMCDGFLTWYSWWLKQPPSGPRPSFLAASRWAWCRRQATVMAATRMLPIHAMATSVPKAQLERGRTGVARGRDFPSVLWVGEEGCREGEMDGGKRG